MSPEFRAALIAAAQRRREAEEELERATLELRRLIAEADELGVPVTVIARTVGLSRKSVYGHLAAAGKR